MDLFPRIMEIKTKTKQMGLIKLKIFYIARKQTKRQPREWEKILILENDAPSKGLISKMYTVHTAQCQNKQPTQYKSKQN